MSEFRDNGHTKQGMDSELYKAAAEGKIEPFKKRKEPLDHLMTPNKNTILHIYLTFPKKRSTEFVHEILSKCPELLLQVNEDGDTPLIIAAKYGHSKAAELLITQAGKDKDLESGGEDQDQAAIRNLLRMKNKKKETALHEAVRSNSVEVVQLILDNEDPEFAYSTNDSGETPLYLAVYNGNIAVASKILNTFKSVDCRGPNGKNALHLAVVRRNHGIIDELMDKKSSLANEVDENGWTPLHYAAYFCSGYSVVEKLLAKDNSAAYIADKDGKRTALHLAACRDSPMIMQKIISKCLDCCELVDIKGWNVLHYAMISKSDSAIKAVLKEPSLIYLINSKDAKGLTPLHMLFASRPYLPSFIREGKTEVYKFLWQKVGSDIFHDVFSPKKKEDILEWMEDLGSGPFGKIVVGKNWEEECKEIEEKVIPELEKAKDSHLVAAALVATVTFAAAFTLPGGYISDENDSEKGSPILSRNSAFTAFVISDAIAMVLSTSSVFIHFIMVMLGYKRRYYWLMRSALWFVVLAMGAMVVAFVTGTYAVLAPSLGLAITTCAIGLSFFLYVFITTIRLMENSVRRYQAEHGGISTCRSLRHIWHESPFYLSCGCSCFFDQCGCSWMWWRVKVKIRRSWYRLTKNRF